MPPIRLIVVTKRNETATNIFSALENAPDMFVSAWAASVPAALAANIAYAPDLVLLDTYAISNPVDLIGTLRRHYPTVKIIACAESPAHVQDMLLAGATGYLLANSATDELLDALRSAHAGKTVIAQHWLRQLFGKRNNA